MKRSKKITLGILVLALWFLPVSEGVAKSLEDGVRFLKQVENVEWYRVDGQNIIIGWRRVPDNFYDWNHKTAVNASKSSLYKVYVWSVRSRYKDWSPGEGGQFCITTAQMGRLGKSSCKN